jgi:hypothetical protein
MILHANNEFLSTTLFTIPRARTACEKRIERNEISLPARVASESFTARSGPGSALVNKFLRNSNRNAPALEVTKSLFEKPPKAPREGTRPTGNDAISAPL